jgi:hypothetical protein
MCDDDETHRDLGHIRRIAEVEGEVLRGGLITGIRRTYLYLIASYLQVR